MSFPTADYFWLVLFVIWPVIWAVELKIGKTFGRGGHTLKTENPEWYWMQMVLQAVFWAGFLTWWLWSRISS